LLLLVKQLFVQFVVVVVAPPQTPPQPQEASRMLQKVPLWMSQDVLWSLQ